MDFHPFRFIFPVTAGIRIGYKAFKNTTFTELIFSIRPEP